METDPGPVYHAELAVIGSSHSVAGAGASATAMGSMQLATDVLIEVGNGKIVSIEPRAGEVPKAAVRLRGLTIPGLVNTHSHAFQRVLRGWAEPRGAEGATDFWDWRDRMYVIANLLDPDQYRRLAVAVYAEMMLAGITTVGEFHYLHHGPGGGPYDDANAMGSALTEAAHRVGIRMTLLDTCYLQANITGAGLSAPQLRFGDGDVDRWIERAADLVSTLRDSPGVQVGVAAHSVRAVSRRDLVAIAGFAAQAKLPLHVHLSEQRSENERCLAVTGQTPTALLASSGFFTCQTTAIHATHLTRDDILALGGAGVHICACPTTERDLGDGIGPYGELADAGATLCVGSDSQVVIDMLEEARGIELHERLASARRGRHSTTGLFAAATSGGARALGHDVGELRAGKLADFVTLDVDTPRLAGGDDTDVLARVVFGATAGDVRHVVVGGDQKVIDGVHVDLGGPRAVSRMLEEAIGPLLRDASARSSAL